MSANRTHANAESSRTQDMSQSGSCVICSRPVSNDNCVQCDQCDSWWHMRGAGVMVSVTERAWTCHNCMPVSVISKSSGKSARIALRLQKLEEERAIQQRTIEAERRAIEQERKLMQEKYNLLEENLDEERANASNRSCVSRQAIFDSVKFWVNHHSLEGAVGGPPVVEASARGLSIAGASLIMEQDAPQSTMNYNSVRETQHQATTMDRSQIRGIQQRSTSAIPNTVSNQRVDGRVTTLVGNPIPSVPPILPPGKPPSYPIINKVAAQSSGSYYQDMLAKLGAISPVVNDTKPAQFIGTEPVLQGQPTSTVPLFTTLEKNENQSAPQANIDPNANGIQSNMSLTIPTPRVSESCPSPSQLAARQIMPSDLPPFAGDPADWPIFISAFINTTAACGYSSVENLIRLQRCLKGTAYESVKSRLMLPESVPQVINTLQLLYGRPELLINILLDKVRSTPVPTAERLETLIEFGLSVQSLCDHLEAAGQRAHLTNPCLLMDLVEQLPAHVKMEWANFMQQYPVVNLKTFGEFMNGVVVSACKVTAYTGTFGKALNGEKSRMMNKGPISAHTSEPEDPNYDENEDKKRCFVCKSRGHRIRDCEKFKALSVDDRWKTAQTNQLCRSCLNAHGRRSCRYALQCGINGCIFRHHPLLHSNRSNQPSHETAPPNVETAGTHTHRLLDQSLLFRIVPVTLYGPKGTVKTYAFLDDGSSLTLVEEELTDDLGVDGRTAPLCLTWTGNVSRMEADSKTMDLAISSTAAGNRQKMKDVRTVKKLALPAQTLQINSLVHKFAHLRGLPISGYANAVPRLLIGVNNLRLTIPLKVKEGHINEPVAMKTRLGWCVYGGSDAPSSHAFNFHAGEYDRDSPKLVKDCFTIEDVGAKPATELMSADDRGSHQILMQIPVRVADHLEAGVRMYGKIESPESYGMALRKLECVECRMERSPLPTVKEEIRICYVNVESALSVPVIDSESASKWERMAQRRDYSTGMVVLSCERDRPRIEQQGLDKWSVRHPPTRCIDQTGSLHVNGRKGAAEFVFAGVKFPTVFNKHHRRWWSRQMQPMLTMRTIWFIEGKMVAARDLRLIVENQKQNSWTRRRVKEAYPGRRSNPTSHPNNCEGALA